MTSLPFFQIDAFATRTFEGNQACVMPLDTFLPDVQLQKIAAENNVAETAFIVPKEDGVWALRWFTPTMEVPLCGHATLASAHALYAHLGFGGEAVAFDTVKSGRLTVCRKPNGKYEMDFPAPAVRKMDLSEDVATALGAWPLEAWGGPFYAVVFASADDIVDLQPDIDLIKRLGVMSDVDRGNLGCLAVQGDGLDVVSRFFAPASGIPEDPATGSWHCMVAAILGPRLKRPLDCYQAYPGRGAKIGIELIGNRVKLRGQAVTVIEGKFTL